MWSLISAVDTTRYSKLTRPCSVGIDLLSPTDCSAVAQAPITRVPNVRSERQRRALLAPSEQWTAHVAYVGSFSCVSNINFGGVPSPGNTVRRIASNPSEY